MTCIVEGYRGRVTARRRIGTDERRARVGMRHRLAPGTQVASVAEAAAALVVIHASDSPSVFLQARARMSTSSPAEIERELYEDRTVLRVLAMRRTLFLVPVGDVPMVDAAASRAVAETERKRTIGMLTAAGIGPDPAGLLEELEVAGLAAVRERGEATTAELTAIDPRLSQKLTLSRGKSYEATISVGQKVFFHLALDGKIGRGRPRGTWVASQFRWSPIERWLPDGIAEMPVDVARAELVRNWLRVFGPGTREDIKWWTGWSLAATKKALAAIDVVEVDLDGGGIGYVLAGDVEPSRHARAMGRAASRARRHDDGLEGARLVSRRASVGAVRQRRKRRPDDLGRRAHRRRLVATRRWRDRPEPARGCRGGDQAGDRLRGCSPRRVDRANRSPVEFLGSADRRPGSRRWIDEALAPDLGAAEERVTARAVERGWIVRQAPTTASSHASISRNSVQRWYGQPASMQIRTRARLAHTTSA